MEVKVGIGQDSHRFDLKNKDKKLILGGVVFEGECTLEGNSDADVILHSITNAISGITGHNIIGEISDEMCLRKGITNSNAYLQEALKYLDGYRITHVSVSIECMKPEISPKIDIMKSSLAEMLNLTINEIGITATSGEGLTSFGKGDGIQVFSIITASRT